MRVATSVCWRSGAARGPNHWLIWALALPSRTGCSWPQVWCRCNCLQRLPRESGSSYWRRSGTFGWGCGSARLVEGARTQAGGGGVCPLSDQNASRAQEDTEDPIVTIEASIDIQRPVVAVFACVADPRNLPQWQRAVNEVQVTPEDPHRGRQGDPGEVVLGREAGAHQRDHRVGAQSLLQLSGPAGPSTVEATSRCEAVGSGTRLSATLQVEPGGLFQVVGPVLASQARK
jgi:uncharacterized protein YndB with AHSA1/START domain